MRWLKDLWRRQTGFFIAGLFGVANASLAATLLDDPATIAYAGIGTFVLVASGYLVADWAQTRSPHEKSRPPVEVRQLSPDEPKINEPKVDTQLTEPPPSDTEARKVDKEFAVMFVHGLSSSPETWSSFERLIRADQDLTSLEVIQFGYATGWVRLRPDTRIPDLDTIAGRMRTRFETLEATYRAVVIVSHSMGGLVVQNFLASMLHAGQGKRLRLIRRIVMFACPNAGSDIFRTLRGIMPVRHPQERQLRPLNDQIIGTQRVILDQVVHTTEVSDRTCPIPIRLYAGEEDNVVVRQSAHNVFPMTNTGVVPGNHFTIIQPDSPAHESYQVLKANLKTALAELDQGTKPQRNP
jgi:pimeloyl-ACP methyl ester carboxylesterase